MTTNCLLATTGLALLGLMAGCASPGISANRAAPNEAVPDWAREALVASGSSASVPLTSVPLTPQDDIPSMNQVHPRTMVTFGLGLGDQTNEINSGNTAPTPPFDSVNTSSTSSQRFRLRGEHYFESGFGVFGEGYIGLADDINSDLGSPDSSQDSAGLFIAAAFRATLDDDFRLPVRFGPFVQMTEVDDVGFTDGSIKRTTVGVRLSAEPEYIIFQKNHNGKISELSVYGEIRTGAGPTKVKDSVDSEDAYAFTLDYEIGVRYRFAFGLLTSLSYVGSKYHVGTTESYNNAVFFGVDDDFNGIMITAGARF